MTTFEKAAVATMAAVLVIVAVALLSLPIPPDGTGLYDDELPNPSRLTLDDRPMYEPDCQTKILSRLKNEPPNAMRKLRLDRSRGGPIASA